jgi:hypothetical protein
MTMTFNEFNRELRAKDIDPKTAYFLAMLFELYTAIMQDRDAEAKVVLELAKAVENVVKLQEHAQQDINRLAKRGLPDGVEVQSSVVDPSDYE